MRKRSTNGLRNSSKQDSCTLNLGLSDTEMVVLQPPCPQEHSGLPQPLLCQPLLTEVLKSKAQPHSKEQEGQLLSWTPGAPVPTWNPPNLEARPVTKAPGNLTDSLPPMPEADPARCAVGLPGPWVGQQTRLESVLCARHDSRGRPVSGLAFGAPGASCPSPASDAPLRGASCRPRLYLVPPLCP